MYVQCHITSGGGQHTVRVGQCIFMNQLTKCPNLKPNNAKEGGVYSMYEKDEMLALGDNPQQPRSKCKSTLNMRASINLVVT